MTPLTKETLEAASSTTEAAAPRTSAPAPSSAHLRSDAVSLEIPVKVHGSRITEVVRGVTPHTEPFEEQTTTMIVFAQGGVVKMSTPVTTGQMMVLTNLKTRQDVICRVLKVRNNPNLQSYVEVEFTHPQPGYWGVFFPSDGPEFASRTTGSVQSLNLESGVKEKSSQDASRPFPPAPNLPGSAPTKAPAPSAGTTAPQSPAPYVAPAQKPESAFISIGSQEKVQVAASSTLSAKNAAPVESVKENRAVNVPATIPHSTPAITPRNVPISGAKIGVSKMSSASDVGEASVAQVPPAAPSLSITEMQGDELSASASSAGTAESEHESQSLDSVEDSAASSRSTFGSFGASPAAASSREMFGSSLGVAGPAVAAHGAQTGKNWMLIVACAAVAAVAAAGGTMYFYRTHAGGATASSASATAPAPPPASVSATSQNPAAQGSPASQSVSASPVAPTNPVASPAPANTRANTTRASKAIVTDSVPSSQTAPSATATLAAGALGAHPVATRRANTQTEAPALEAGMISPGTGSALAGIPGASNALPPPPAAPERVGGELKGPKLISSIPPVYPLAAKQAMVDGDVVIHATIDKSGNVTDAQVVSGPSILRDAALAAVRRWKYAPSMLDGQTISSETTVTLKFRR